jgi:asparagine synthetase B (glutamine-hydrolysing)
MGGIAAQYGATDPAAGRRMLARIAHRGPDEEGEALRSRLGDDRFRTSSDNEVALHMVEREGRRASPS